MGVARQHRDHQQDESAGERDLGRAGQRRRLFEQAPTDDEQEREDDQKEPDADLRPVEEVEVEREDDDRTEEDPLIAEGLEGEPCEIDGGGHGDDDLGGDRQLEQTGVEVVARERLAAAPDLSEQVDVSVPVPRPLAMGDPVDAFEVGIWDGYREIDELYQRGLDGAEQL